MNDLLFISYFTKFTPYEQIVHKCLLPSFNRFNLRYYIFEIESKGHWRINAIQKPLIIKEALNNFPKSDIVWNDADSEILQFPQLFFDIPQKYDLAVNYLNWQDHYGKEGQEMLDGTVLWRNNKKIHTFIDDLILLSTNKNKDHQKAMAGMLKNTALTVFPLPREYSYIATQPNGQLPVKELEEPVIIHHQASRQYKGKLFKKG